MPEIESGETVIPRKEGSLVSSYSEPDLLGKWGFCFPDSTPESKIEDVPYSKSRMRTPPFFEVYPASYKSLITADDCSRIMGAIAGLEREVKKLSDDVAMLSGRLDADKMINEKLLARGGRKYVFFLDEPEFKRALSGLEREGIDAQLMGYGTLEVTGSAIGALQAMGLRFGVASNMKEVYEEKSLVEYWDNLVEVAYGSSQDNDRG